MSPKMAAIVGYIIGENWTNPRITGFSVTSDGFVLCSTNRDPSYNGFIGSLEDLRRNWYDLLEYAELTPEEYTEANRLFSLKVKPFSYN